MELSKGICFFCSNTKIITKPTETVLSKIKSFLNNSAIDQNQLNNIKPLKVCPMCYHKIHLLVKLNKNISSADKNGTYSCTLCGSLDEIIKVNKWDTFDKIASDFPVLTGNLSPVCSACLFFLDTRYYIKEKLISVYPNLRIEVKIPKFDDNITSHSTPISKKRDKTSKSDLKSIPAKSRTSDVEKRILDKSSIKINPLGKQNDLKLPETVKNDHKFMNEILIIGLQGLNGSIEKTTEFIKLETGTNVRRRSRNSKDSEDNKNSEVSRKTRGIKEVEENNECKESEESEVKESKQHKDKEIKNKTEIKDKSKTKELKKKTSRIIEVSSDSGEENKVITESEVKESKQRKDKSRTNKLKKKKSRIVEVSSDSGDENKVDVKKKQFFKIRLNQKTKKPAKKEIQVKQKVTESSPVFKRKLSINLEQLKMPEKNIDEDTNVVESEDSIDLELKDDDPLSPEKRIDTETATASDEKMETSGDEKIDISGVEKMETSADDKTQSTEENTQTTNEDTENLAHSVEEEPAKETPIDQNGLEIENDSEKSEEIEEKEPSTQEKPENTDIEVTEKSDSEKTEDKNEHSYDSEATDKNESENPKDKNEGRISDSEATEKNESDDEYIAKDDIEISDGKENEEGATSKSEENSALDENNVEEVTEQNGEDAKKDDVNQEVDNDSQGNDDVSQEDDQATQESTNVTQEDSNLISSIENNENYISEIEAALEGYETVSELEKDDDPPSVVTLDSTQEEVDGDAGKRKRSESVSDTNGPERKKKKVTFSEDVVSDD